MKEIFKNVCMINKLSLNLFAFQVDNEIQKKRIKFQYSRPSYYLHVDVVMWLFSQQKLWLPV